MASISTAGAAGAVRIHLSGPEQGCACASYRGMICATSRLLSCLWLIGL